MGDREKRYLRVADLESIIDNVTSKVFEKYSDQVTESWIGTVTEKLAEKVNGHLDKTIEAKLANFNERLEELVTINTGNISEIEALKAENDKLTVSLDDLTSRLVKLESQTAVSPSVDSSSKEIDDLKERLEERTNR